MMTFFVCLNRDFMKLWGLAGYMSYRYTVNVIKSNKAVFKVKGSLVG
jgi:hypothetical protein